jgi:hypothetical protein
VAKISEGVEMKRYWLLLLLTVLIACQPVMPAPTQTSFPTLAPSPVIPMKYELRQPEATDLLALIDSILRMEEEMTYNNDLLTAVLGREPSSLHHLIGEDFERYYLDGFPYADDLVAQENLPWEMKSFGDMGSFSIILRIALLQYINNHQYLLENTNSFHLPNSNIRTFSMDLDGDGDLEWLIGAAYEEYNLENWLLLNKQEDDRYHFLQGFNDGWVGVWNSSTEILVHDLTGDGNPEIAKILYSYFAGRDSGTIKIYTWSKDRLSLLKSIPLPGSPPVYEEISDYAIDDFNGDGVAEIRVDSPQFGRFGCQWTKSSVYYLDGRSPDVEVTGEEIPQADECLIARALDSRNAGEQIQLYQEALRKFSPDVSPMDKLTWIRLQLAMTYTANGDDVRANSLLQDLINMDGEGNLLKYIQDKYMETDSPSPLVFCDALYSSITSQDIPKSIGSEIDVDLMHGAYPIDYAPIADLVCPFPDVLGRRLNNIKIPASELPMDVLAAQGYSFLWTQSSNWDGDSEQEWLGILNFRQPMLVFMDSDKNWNIDVVEIYSSNLSEFESNIYTPVDGAGIKVIVLFSGAGKYCDSPNTVKWLIEIDPDTMEYDNMYLCDPNQYSLASESDIQYAVEEFSKPNYFESFEAPDWYYLEDAIENEYERRTILDLVSELENEVVEQTGLKETASRTSELIASLPKDDPVARPLLNRLYFLNGLNYELGGQDELAVEAYLELIEFFPESLWSQYAQLRIQPVK